MPRAVSLACVLALLAPAVAAGQTTPGGVGDAPPLVPQPPVTAPEPDAPEEPAERRPVAQAGELPDTGADARFVALLGAGLVLSGVGLRLRTTDERF